MTTNKKMICIVLACMLCLGCCISAFAEPAFKAGVYTAAAKGNNDDVSVEVVFGENAIESVKVTSHNETPGLSDGALATIPEAIVEKQSLAVDTVSGATNTSKAILAAVEECVVLAGGNPDAMKAAEEKTLEVGENENVDIVIVGAGLAGIMAANELQTRHPDLSYVLLEKLDVITGSLPGTGGIIVTTTSKLHEAAGLTTTSEDIADLMEVMSGVPVNRTLISNVYSESTAAMNELLDNGFVCNEKIEVPSKYSSTVYGLRADGRGAGLTEFVKKFAEDKNLNIRTGSKAVSLLAENGAVTGVHVEDKEKAYDIQAKAVLLTTGGFGSNPEMLAELCPDYAYDDVIISTNAGATGDAIEMTKPFGTKLVGYGTMGSARAIDGGSLITSNFIINGNGERFIDETEPLYVINSVIVEQQNRQAWYLTDATYANQETLATRLADGAVQKFDTIEALAEGIGVPVENLKATVESYNAAVDDGKNPEFGLPCAKANPLKEAPFYACKIKTRIFGTIAGVEVNDYCQVLDGNGQAIPGLYAGGEVMAGNAFTKQYVTSGVGIGFALTCGQYIANQAAEAIAK